MKRTSKISNLDFSKICTVCYRFSFNGQEKDDEILGSGNAYTADNWEYDSRMGRRWNLDPLAHQFPHQSPYMTFDGNPIINVDPDGRAAKSSTGETEDWVEKADGKIYWDEKATSQATTKDGEKYLGKNVLVGSHNRDEKLNEPINSAQFDLYLESNKEGASATIMGNTVPADNKTAGTLAEGLYPARAQGRATYLAKGREDLAILLNEGKSVPTAPGSPKSTMTEVFFHSGNNYQTSLFDSRGKPYSVGCQTSGCGADSYAGHKKFMGTVGTKFKGIYYLRPKPIIEVPKTE